VSRTSLIAVAAVAATLAGAGLGASSRPPGEPTQLLQMTTTVTSTVMDVHVAGWVRSPGVVQLPEGSIVADAVEAAGGFRPGAGSDTLNLAAPLTTGDQVYVSGPGEESQSPVDDGVVAVNRATASDLEGLPGVGPVLAERIVAYRDANGPFEQVEDLLDVPGIGESKLASMRDMARIP
jgi:competence protein ComEA